MSATKQVVQKATTEIAVADDMFEDAGAGLENTTSEDFAIPFISPIQALSPQRNKQKSEYIEGAEEGMIFNSVNGELFNGEEGIMVIPCSYTKNVIEWRVRETEGGGLIDIHPAGYRAPNRTERAPNGTERDDRGRDRVLNTDGKMTSSQLVPTASFFCLLIDATGAFKNVVINMSSTQMKKSKRWMTMIAENMAKHPKTGQMVTLPMFSNVYHLSLVPESNDKGSWFGWAVAKAKRVDLNDPAEAAMYRAAKAFHGSVKSGEAKAQYEGEATVVDSDDEGTEY